MKDFRPNILYNLRTDPWYVEDPDRIETLNNILNDLESLGFDRLVQKFCTQPDPERACDFLFEIWIFQMLRRNQDVQALQYEPPGSQNPPDFRFFIHGVSFDLQVKRLHNVTHELTKLLFKRECQKHLSVLAKPWFINFWVSDQFTRQDLSPFFAFLKRSINQFSPVMNLDTLLEEPQYSWEQNGTTLVRFSFFEKRNKEPGISPGVTYLMGTENGLMAPIDTDAFRKSVKRLLTKSRKTMVRPVSPTQANLLVMQSVHFSFADKTMPATLYGDEGIRCHRGRDPELFRQPNGLFRPNNFSNINGLILVPSQVRFFYPHFEGDFYLHSSHFQNIRGHPKPFKEMMFVKP
ncbi:hypothetical protein ACTRXD_09005 [Nitrospira sp. T9]|uniref:hypothetical protein n=1 Tax=unclassified Nitrospira TaxID=2652172 RepID=UPI003F9D1E7F